MLCLLIFPIPPTTPGNHCPFYCFYSFAFSIKSHIRHHSMQALVFLKSHLDDSSMQPEMKYSSHWAKIFLLTHSSASPLAQTIRLSLGHFSQSVVQRPLCRIIWKGCSACRSLGPTADPLYQNLWELDPRIRILISSLVILLNCIWTETLRATVVMCL